MEAAQLSFDEKMDCLRRCKTRFLEGINQDDSLNDVSKYKQTEFFTKYFDEAIKKIDIKKNEEQYENGINAMINIQLEKEGKTMEQLQINKGLKTLNSLEVAEMVEKPHKNLLRDIRQYCEYLAETKIEPGEFFIESTYKDGNNQDRPCYLITKKGCDMVANKLTGKKGTVFTARYVTRFDEMERKTLAIPTTPEGIIKVLLQASDDNSEHLKTIDNRVTNIEENTRLDPGQYSYLGKLISRRISEVKQVHKLDLNRRQNGELYRGLNKEINEITGVRTRTDLRQRDFETVCEFVESWEPSSATMVKVKSYQEPIL